MSTLNPRKLTSNIKVPQPGIVNQTGRAFVVQPVWTARAAAGIAQGTGFRFSTSPAWSDSGTLEWGGRRLSIRATGVMVGCPNSACIRPRSV